MTSTSLRKKIVPSLVFRVPKMTFRQMWSTDLNGHSLFTITFSLSWFSLCGCADKYLMQGIISGFISALYVLNCTLMYLYVLDCGFYAFGEDLKMIHSGQDRDSSHQFCLQPHKVLCWGFLYNYSWHHYYCSSFDSGVRHNQSLSFWWIF